MTQTCRVGAVLDKCPILMFILILEADMAFRHLYPPLNNTQVMRSHGEDGDMGLDQTEVHGGSHA